MPRRCLPIPVLSLLVFGCGQPDAPALMPGDIVRPDVSFAPKAPWSEGVKVTIGMLARVERPGGEGHYLNDEDVPLDRAVLFVRVTFLDGERSLGDPLEVPLLHDC